MTYSHFFAFVGIVFVVLAIYFLVRNRSSNVKKSTTRKLSVGSPRVEPQTVSTATIVGRQNQWSLHVLGNVKFDICVEWSDGSHDILSGTAPKEFKFTHPIKLTPVNTMGIPPEWADDGISYQWYLNDCVWN